MDGADVPVSTPNEVTLTEPTPPVEEAPDRDTLLAERRTLEHAPYSDLAAMRLRELDDLLATPPVEEAPDLLARVRAAEARAAAIDGRLIELVRERWRESGLMWDRSAAVDAIEAVLGALTAMSSAARPVSGDTEGREALARTIGASMVLRLSPQEIADRAWSAVVQPLLDQECRKREAFQGWRGDEVVAARTNYEAQIEALTAERDALLDQAAEDRAAVEQRVVPAGAMTRATEQARRLGVPLWSAHRIVAAAYDALASTTERPDKPNGERPSRPPRPPVPPPGGMQG